MSAKPHHPDTFEHPSCLFVNHIAAQNGDEAKVLLQLPFYPRILFGIQCKLGRTFVFERRAKETLRTFLDRFLINFNAHFGPGINGKKRKLGTAFTYLTVVDVRVMRHSASPTDESLLVTVPDSTCLEAAFDSGQGMHTLFLSLNLGDPSVEVPEGNATTKNVTLNVKLDRSYLRRCRLDHKPMVGCPILPNVDAYNLSNERSRFEWYVSEVAPLSAEAKWPDEPTATGITFTPKADHLGRWLKLRILPFDDAGMPGVPFGTGELAQLQRGGSNRLEFFGQYTFSKWVISQPPVQALHQERFLQTKERTSIPNEFRVVTYNLLADMYSSTAYANNYIFYHCPSVYLNSNYRLPLTLREILAYNADILCLQEVDTRVFSGQLVPLLHAHADMQGVFQSKVLHTPVESNLIEGATTLSSCPGAYTITEKQEGVAVFFRRSRFRLIKQHNLHSLLTYAEQFEDLRIELSGHAKKTDWAERIKDLQTMPADTHLLKAHSQGMVACFLEDLCKDPDSPSRYLLVISTHYYYHRDADVLRAVQAEASKRFIDCIINEAISGGIVGRHSVSIIIGADFNSNPGSLAYTRLGCYEGNTSAPNTRFHSAYAFQPETPTNWVPNFIGLLDAVLYRSPLEEIQVTRTLSVPTKEAIVRACSWILEMDSTIAEPLITGDLGHCLPNSQFSSDHISLVVDFCWSPINTADKKPESETVALS